jgi:uncharacterized protein YndB with AHSA1/START domain
MDPGTTTYETPTDTDIVATRVFDAPRRLVWKAWTDPRHITRWMLGPEGWTMPVCEMDLRPGGSWRYVWRRDQGTEMEMTGSVLEVVPPERLVTTERWGADWPEATNILVLTESGGRTTATLTMRYVSKDVRDRALGTGMTGGMDISFDRLDRVLGTLA